jgi:hypothetical protein
MGTINLRSGCKNAKDPTTRANEPAHISAEEFKKQKPNNESLPNQ